MQPTHTIHLLDRLSIEAIRDVCRRYPVRELSLFGSALTDGFREESDVDFLIDFGPESAVGFLTLAEIQEQLSAIVNRRVDLVPKRGLKAAIREDVSKLAELIYAK